MRKSKEKIFFPQRRDMKAGRKNSEASWPLLCGAARTGFVLRNLLWTWAAGNEVKARQRDDMRLRGCPLYFMSVSFNLDC